MHRAECERQHCRAESQTGCPAQSFQISHGWTKQNLDLAGLQHINRTRCIGQNAKDNTVRLRAKPGVRRNLSRSAMGGPNRTWTSPVSSTLTELDASGRMRKTTLSS